MGRANTTHGQTHSAEYMSWRAMKARATNPADKDWGNYGGRGIVVCAEWLNDFPAFLHDMGERPSGTTLDRVDNDGNYEPTNCRWADASAQAMNRRKGLKRRRRARTTTQN